jgi:aminomethyltransferase
MPAPPTRTCAWMTARSDEWGLGVDRCAPRRDLAMIAVQGPKARAKVWQPLPESPAASAPLKPFFAARSATRPDRPHRLHRRGRLRIMLPAAAGRGDLERAARRRRPALRSRRARHAAPRSRHEPVWPGHGRASVSPLDAGLAWTVDLEERRATSSARRRSAGKTAAQKLPRPAAPRPRRAARPPEGRFARRARARSPAAPSRRRCSSRSPWRACRWRAVGDTVEVAIRDRLLAARVVKPCFVGGKRLV